MRDKPAVTEHHISTTRTARYAQLGDARGPVAEVWVVCHGYGQLAARFLSRFAVLDDGSRLIIAPEALSRFYLAESHGPHTADHKVGASWVTHEDRDAEIADQIAYLDVVCERIFSELDRGATKLVLLGFSQGASTAARWLLRGSVRVDALVLWGGGVPRDVFTAAADPRLARLTITIVVGDRDAIVSSERVAEHLAELDASGLRYTLLRHGGGHDIEDAPLLQTAAEVRAGRGPDT